MDINSLPTPLILGFDGTELNRNLANFLEKVNPAGIILFSRNLKNAQQSRRLIRDIRDLLGSVLVTIDHEGGAVSRLPADMPSAPSPASLGRLLDWERIQEAIRLQAEVLAWLDIDLNLAPVLDLYVSDKNRALATRTFHDNSELVARYGLEMITGHADFGIGTCAKHFPGFGACEFDPHFSTGHFNASEGLWRRGLAPFQEAIQGGALAIMSTHALYPGRDPENIATFSSALLRDLLRDRLHFQGLVLTDCIEMAGTGPNTPSRELVSRCLKAGNDLIISSFSLKKNREFQEELANGIRQAAAKNTNVAAMWQKSLARIQDMNGYLVKARPDNLPKMKAVHRLHRALLDIRAWQPITAPNGILMLEISTTVQAGINLDEPVSQVGRILQNHPRISEALTIAATDQTGFLAVRNRVLNEARGLILLTNELWQTPACLDWVRTLADVPATIHIALATDHDLTNSCKNECAVWGANHTSGQMLYEMLDEIIQSE